MKLFSKKTNRKVQSGHTKLSFVGKGQHRLSLWRAVGSLILSSLVFFFYLSTFSASAQVTQVTSAQGITLQFTLPNLTFTDISRDTIRYQEVRYAECQFTGEPGNPKVPVTRLLLGIPATAIIEAVDISGATAETRAGVRLTPVSVYAIQAEDTYHSASQRWVESGSAYRSRTANASYPGLPLARIVREGYIRNQRVIGLALYPVQYFPKSRQLRLYSRFTVNIRFSYGSGAIGLTKFSSHSSPSRSGSGSGNIGFPNSRIPMVSESEVFERAFSRHLLNAEEAAHFRAPRPLVPAAPTLGGIGNSVRRYKLFVKETGIYALTAESLALEWGIDLKGTHPARLRVMQGNHSDVPIYISGAADSSFDAKDAIFFLAISPKIRIAAGISTGSQLITAITSYRGSHR